VYRIEFISNWSSTAHPTDYPTSSAHWSPLIGTTHKNASAFLQLGLLASDGVEEVAETGGTTIITQEINLLIAAGLAFEVINGSGLSTGLGTITVNDVGVDLEFPHITLITMIAPSPDWVAQINNLKLTDTDNNWMPSISMDVYATDAGTDSGVTYTSPNADTNPAENISSLQNTLPFSDQIVGTFVFTLQEVLSIEDNLFQNSISIYPNPTSGKVYLNTKGEFDISKVEIFDLNGRNLRSYQELRNREFLVLHDFKSGVYLLRMHFDNNILTKKIIIK
ncbi:MAG: spondin domain-containing protein, partial [Flavobacteriaceae bacterium]|nr:spondin domain-containing protein [Flavobacteriaceae bacterium]